MEILECRFDRPKFAMPSSHPRGCQEGFWSSMEKPDCLEFGAVCLMSFAQVMHLPSSWLPGMPY